MIFILLPSSFLFHNFSFFLFHSHVSIILVFLFLFCFFSCSFVFFIIFFFWFLIFCFFLLVLFVFIIWIHVHCYSLFRYFLHSSWEHLAKAPSLLTQTPISNKKEASQSTHVDVPLMREAQSMLNRQTRNMEHWHEQLHYIYIGNHTCIEIQKYHKRENKASKTPQDSPTCLNGEAPIASSTK